MPDATDPALHGASPPLVVDAERLPAAISADELRKYFNLTPADLEQVARCRGAANKLGFSVQLCTLRWRGHFLAETATVPAALLEALAPQLGLLPLLLEEEENHNHDDQQHGAVPSLHALPCANCRLLAEDEHEDDNDDDDEGE